MSPHMDAERRRRLMELSRWHDESQIRHDIADAFGPESTDPKSPQADPRAGAD